MTFDESGLPAKQLSETIIGNLVPKTSRRAVQTPGGKITTDTVFIEPFHISFLKENDSFFLFFFFVKFSSLSRSIISISGSD